MVAILLRPPFSDLTYFCPGVLGALAGVDFAQPLRAAARDDGANTGLPVNSSHGHLVTRSCRHTVNSSPVHSSQTRLITQSTRHKRAHGFDTVYICNSAYGLSLYPLLTHWSVTLTPIKRSSSFFDRLFVYESDTDCNAIKNKTLMIKEIIMFLSAIL